MTSFPLADLGGRQTGPATLSFGVLLPWVTPGNGQSVHVLAVHEEDQFLQDVPALAVPLQHSLDPQYGDCWSGDVDVSAGADLPAGNHWGQPGRYVYRLVVVDPRQGSIDWVIDPYAREFGVGRQSAVSLDPEPYVWSGTEGAWRVPVLDDLVMYEINVAEFRTDLRGAVGQLDYLADLGVNCLSLMPLSNVAAEVDWGYLPIGYFGVDERFGGGDAFKGFVEAAHARGLAVIIDSVYGHASRALFPYQYLYDRLGYQDNPFMGPFAEDLFADQGASIDYRRPLVQDFFLAVNEHWLTEFHVDGFRYDCVPNYWDGALGVGYAKLAYRTHELVRDEVTAGGLARFGEADALRLIQCAEQLEDPVGVLWQSCSDCTWQDGTLSAARDTAHGKDGAIASFGNALGLLGFPSEVPMNGAQVRRTALQYVESHDHSRLLTEFGVLQVDEAGNPLFLQGDRRLWFKLQPYLIGLLCAKGIPMLEAGQELGEDFTLPGNGLGRVGLLRPVDWNLFYDDPGRALVRLTRTLLRLRRQRDELRQGDHWYYDDPLHQDAGVMVFRRGLADRATVVAVNFTDRDATVDLVMPGAGTWSEQLHGQDDVVVGSTGETSRLAVPSNYGRVWTHGTAAHEALEKPVTGTDAAKAEAAAVKAVGSGTAGAVTTDVSGNGYEVTVTKSDRSTVEVHLDQSFAVDDHGRLGG